MRFGDAPALRFTVVADDEIVALAPPGTGAVEVTVTGPAGPSSAAGAALRFTYLPQPAASFTDLPADHWAYADVQLLAELGRWAASRTAPSGRKCRRRGRSS